MNQLDRIMEVTGRPTQEDIDAINSPFAATMLDNLPGADARRLHEMFPNASPVRAPSSPPHEALPQCFGCSLVRRRLMLAPPPPPPPSVP